MGRQYAAILELRDPLGHPVTAQRVAALVGEWAGITDPLIDGRRNGRNAAVVSTRVLDPGDGDGSGWRFRFSKTDPSPRVTWDVDVAVAQGQRTVVSVELLRTATDGLVLPFGDFAIPRVIAELLTADGIEAKDSRFRVSTSVSVLDPSRATATLCALLFDPRRRLPVVGISLREDDPVDAQVLLDRLAGNVHVWMIDDRASWALQRCLPQGLNVYNGAVRLWWPGLEAGSARWQHPLWLPRIPARTVQNQICELVTDAAVDRFHIPKEVLDLERGVRAQAHARERRRREEVTRDLQAQMTTLDDEALDTVGRLEGEVAKARHHADAAEDEAIKSIERAEEAEARAAQLLAQLDAAQVELEWWRTTSARPGEAAGVRTDEEVFSDEVTTVFTELYADFGGRPRQLRPYRLGSEFLASLIRVENPRDKVVQVCAQIAGGLQEPFNLSLQDHPLRTSDAGDAPARRRPSDGAEARRCYIERNTPSARRLHYWRTPGGELEFAAVVRHDDLQIPYG